MVHAPHEYQRAPLPLARETEPETSTDAQAPPRPGAAHTQAPAPGAKKQRNALFDNAKFLAIVLVAMAHAWEPIMDGSRTTRALYMFVYTFHMPAFIIISGYFSRSFDMRPDRLRRLVTGVVVPYVIFETTYSLYEKWGNNDPGHEISLLDPYFLTWFLIALFIWRLTTPIWLNLRYPLTLSLVIALLASVTPNIGDDLDLQRVLQFLPFFVLGLKLRPEHFQWVQRRGARPVAVVIMLATVVFAYWAAPRMTLNWFYRGTSAQQLGVDWWEGIVMTLGLTACGLVLTACFLALVPRNRTWFTGLGAGTLCGYLLHGLLIKTIEYTGLIDDYGWLKSPLGEVFATLFMAAAVTLFCTPPVRRVMRFATEPEMKWAFRSDPVQNAREREREREKVPA
ncbi:acyltransferase family protein [Streptomyces sp. NPDC059398]|uniref:acyltransferase family protein n=1 Tax=Streptomyces sp. NPDC059398 TaxID=3346820 RepID=UPI00368068CD